MRRNHPIALRSPNALDSWAAEANRVKMALQLGKRALSWATGGCLLLLACGGAYRRGGTDENTGGTAAGGTANEPATGGTSSNGRAGGQASAGSPTSVAGSATMMPTPTRDPEPCYNDTDCPNASCGGEVCNWTKSHPRPVGDKFFVCDPAGIQPKGKDGWCTTDENCKCLGLGARCIAPYCSFTKPSDAPGR